MDREATEATETRKRAAPPSTVSLASSYDRDADSDLDRSSRDRWSWALLVMLVGLVLIAIGLVLLLDRGDNNPNKILVEAAEVPSQPQSPLGANNLTAPQKKVAGWLKEVRNASELYVEGGSSSLSLTGVIFPRNSSAGSILLDAVAAINYEVYPIRQQTLAVSSGRGYEWNATLSDFGEIIISSGCMSKKPPLLLDELDSAVLAARWADGDESEVRVRYDGDTYNVSRSDLDAFGDINTDTCWLVDGEDVTLYACTPASDERLAKSDFSDTLQMTNECPNLEPNSTHAVNRGKEILVPLPLREWYASYKGPGRTR